MSSRGLRSTFSSPEASPDPRNDRYDPFQDPVELAHLSRPSPGARDSYGSNNRSRSQSPDAAARGRLRPDSYFGGSQPGGHYAPLSGRNESPRPSLRSGRESVYTLSSLYQTKTVDADTQALVDRRAGEIAHWHVHWTTPALITSLFLAGVAAAIGHHYFYTSLNGQEAKDQLKMIRYGTALAFFVKSTLVGTVIMCNRQRIWRTFRTKAMTINGIDGLFSACEDPTQFFLNWEMMRNGKLATLMAACSWLIPIASVLSPAALTTVQRPIQRTDICRGVGTVNFTREAVFNFRNQNDRWGSLNSLNYYNTTERPGTTGEYFDYYDQPTRSAKRIAFSTAYLKRPQVRMNARTEFCGLGWNCTYTISFVGPGYKCEDVTGTTGTPLNQSLLAPIGNFTYMSQVEENVYKMPQIETLEGRPVAPPPYPPSLGVFESEPMIWIAFANKTDELYPADSPYAKKWKHVHKPSMFKCVMYHTNYTFDMSYNATQNTTRTQRDFLYPVVDTNVTRLNQSSWTASPASNFVRPQDAQKYKKTAAYHSMGHMLRSFLKGNMEKTSDVLLVTRSDISETVLLNATSAYPLPNLMEAVQEMFEDMLITLISDTSLVVADTIDVPCVKSQNIVVYRYLRRALWIGYAVVISLTFTFILVGAYSIYQNGVASDVLFSRIMVTTRNPTLDHLSVGACLGGDPFPEELVQTKLRFGVLLEDDPREGPLGKVEHCTFGTMGETKAIVKGGTYAGLKKYRRDQRDAARGAEEEKPLLASGSDC